MNFEHDARTQGLITRLQEFMDAHVYPAEQTYQQQLDGSGAERWRIPPIVEDLKLRAKSQGLWNLFLPESPRGAGLKNLEYAPLCEIMGRVEFASEVFNCSAPDTGNMELLERYGTPEQKEKWLEPLLAGETRSAYLMTEPAVASSDATNIETEIRRDGDHYIINGRKWWASGIGDPRCRVLIVMGKTDVNAPRHLQQSQILVPRDTPGVNVVRMLPVFGFDDAPHGHGEVVLDNVRVPKENLILGEGRGFEVAQGRLGPGRIHHCMRTIGAAERALEAMCRRLASRVAFAKPLAQHSVWGERVAEARVNIEMTRLLTLKAAYMMDTAGNKAAQGEIAMIKVAGPKVALKVVDDAIQAFGGAGVSSDPGLARMYASLRTMRIVDGPDEVHNRTIARLEFNKYSTTPQNR
ncbi:MAG TPA: acyl-CoA dehydrogenase family protein [Steroidobacteraceae bacterium]|nr:acyl-CoA dehydrogenase family protein [Steroidobacteraceae bacterium]